MGNAGISNQRMFSIWHWPLPQLPVRLLIPLIVLFSTALSWAQQQPSSGVVKVIRAAANAQCEPFLVVGDNLFIVTPGPSLSVYDIVTLQQLASIPIQHTPTRLLAQDSAIVDSVYASNRKTLLSLNGFAPVRDDPYDVAAYVERTYRNDARRPLAMSYAYVWQGRLFARPSSGELAIYSAGDTRRVPYDVALGGSNYHIYLHGPRPLGFTDHSVLALDSKLIPTRRIFTLPPDQGIIHTVASDGKTIAILRGHLTQELTLEIWPISGTQPIAHTPVGPGLSPTARPQWLVPFAGGCLFACNQFAWLHPDGRQWHTKPATQSASMLSHEPHIALTHHRILINDRSGDVHIIDPSVVLGRPVPPPSYEGGPKPMLPTLAPAR